MLPDRFWTWKTIWTGIEQRVKAEKDWFPRITSKWRDTTGIMEGLLEQMLRSYCWTNTKEPSLSEYPNQVLETSVCQSSVEMEFSTLRSWETRVESSSFGWSSLTPWMSWWSIIGLLPSLDLKTSNWRTCNQRSSSSRPCMTFNLKKMENSSSGEETSLQWLTRLTITGGRERSAIEEVTSLQLMFSRIIIMPLKRPMLLRQLLRLNLLLSLLIRLPFLLLSN